MNPRINLGKGVTGTVRYVLGQGRDAKTGHFRKLNPGEESRVEWIVGTGFGFDIRSAADAELARRVMEFDARHQGSRTKKCDQDCVHLTLAWKPGEKPSQAEMVAAAHDALKALGMANARALFVAHRDEDYAHVHIVASRINPETNRAYNLTASYRTLSTWAEGYEREHGGVISLRRQDMNELRRAIADRDADAVLEGMTKHNATFSAAQLARAIDKEIKDFAEAARFKAKVLASPEIVGLIDAAAAQDRSAEPWMKMSGGLEALGEDHRASAEASYQVWATEKNPEAAKRHDLADYVRYVQTKWAEEVAARAAQPRMADRYTTRAVLVAEKQVLRAAEELAGANTHAITERQRAAILGRPGYRKTADGKGITAEQENAFRHATAASGIVLIDGMAGTGKSFALGAIREAYEAAGCKVVGLAPSNKVAKALAADGFTQAATIHAEIFGLNNGRRTWDGKTVVVVDEAAMIDTKMMAMLTAHAAAAGAKLILAGDDRQLSSIDYGGMFTALIQKHGAAAISQVRRQHKNDDRRASEMLATGNFSEALGIYDKKSAIHWTRTQGEARAALIEQWARDSAEAPEKTRFVFAYTNADVATLNAALRGVRRERGEIGIDHEFLTAKGRASFAAGDRIQFTGKDRKLGIDNGGTGTIRKIDGGRVTVKLDGGKKAATITFDTAAFDKFSHGYAGTIYKGQGATVDQAYLYHSEHWKAAASYVSLTRHREGVALFVARNTAKDLKQLARQMARSEEKRAASMFAPMQEAAPTRLLTPAELLATIAPDFAATAAEARAEQTASPAAPAAAAVPETAEGETILGKFARAARAITGRLFGPDRDTAAAPVTVTAAEQERLARTLRDEAARIVREERDARQALGFDSMAEEAEAEEQTRQRRRKRGRSL